MPVQLTFTDGVSWSEESMIADAERVLERLDLSGAELSVLLTDDATIRPLNARWRGIDRATDVLSFSQLEGEAIGQPSMLGDVVISLESAERQARELGHDTAREVRVLLVHGICHVLGHDHTKDEAAEKMEALERELLALLERPVD
jgi:probable rRNA maturation factor